MYPDRTHFSVLLDLPAPSLWPPYKKEEDEKKKYQVQFVLPMYSLEHGQTHSAQPLKENESFLSPPHPHQKPSTMKS